MYSISGASNLGLAFLVQKLQCHAGARGIWARGDASLCATKCPTATGVWGFKYRAQLTGEERNSECMLGLQAITFCNEQKPEVVANLSMICGRLNGD